MGSGKGIVVEAKFKTVRNYLAQRRKGAKGFRNVLIYNSIAIKGKGERIEKLIAVALTSSVVFSLSSYPYC